MYSSMSSTVSASAPFCGANTRLHPSSPTRGLVTSQAILNVQRDSLDAKSSSSTHDSSTAPAPDIAAVPTIGVSTGSATASSDEFLRTSIFSGITILSRTPSPSAPYGTS